MTKAMEIELTAARARELATSIRDTITETQMANTIASIKLAAEEGKFRVVIDEELAMPVKMMLKALGYGICLNEDTTEVSW